MIFTCMYYTICALLHYYDSLGLIYIVYIYIYIYIYNIDVNNVTFTLYIVEEKYALFNVIYFLTLFIMINSVKI